MSISLGSPETDAHVAVLQFVSLQFASGIHRRSVNSSYLSSLSSRVLVVELKNQSDYYKVPVCKEVI
jgi:hypothetical protein